MTNDDNKKAPHRSPNNLRPEAFAQAVQPYTALSPEKMRRLRPHPPFYQQAPDLPTLELLTQQVDLDFGS